MELELNERSESGKKRKIRIIAGLFFGTLLVFTFFSNTLLRSVPSEKETILVSKLAIHEDQSGKYVYVHKSYIKTADSTENVSAVVEGVFQMDEIIIESSEPLQDGQRVRI